MNVHQHKRHGDIEIGNGMAAIIIIAVVFIGTGLAGINPFWNPLATTGTGTGTGTGTSTGTQAVNKKIAFSANDPIGGSAPASGTYVVYDQNSVQLESLTAASDSTVTSAQTYNSGTLLKYKISVSSYLTQFGQFIVPYMTPADAQASSTNNVKFNWIKLGAWSATITGTAGTTLSDGRIYDFSAGVGSTATLTLNVAWAETTTNAGFLGCNSAKTVNYDFINKVCRRMLMEVSDTASSPGLTVTGFPRLNTIGTSKYWNVVLPDGLTTSTSGAWAVIGAPGASTSLNDPGDSQAIGSLSYYSSGNQIAGGNAVVSFNVALGSVTTTENLAIKLWYYADPAYFPANSNYGPDATQSGSTITITFRP